MNWTEEQYQEYLQKKGVQVVKDTKPKKAKYNNNHVWVDGICFDSGQEAEYYGSLKLLMRAGAIKGFCRQPQFILVEGNEKNRAITYSADFIVFHNNGSYEIIDTKGFESEQWKRTLKQFKLKYPGLELKIVKE
jgi:hypothetical protein